jgi:uncharacterized protein with HEPN domain
MRPLEDNVRLRHMLDHAVEALQMSQAKTRADLDSNRQLNLSLVRLLEVVGEAAARVSSQTQCAHPDVPWPDIVGLRNRLIHGFDEVDFNILWDVIRKDLPSLIAQLRTILGE